MKSQERSYRQLARRYFTDVASSVLDPYLTGQGFRRTRAGPDEVRYRREGCLLSFGFAPYATDETPRYALTAAIGSPRGWLRKPRLIGLWQMPCPDRGGKRWQWEFRGPDQLERELKRVLRLLDTYARPLWEDQTQLDAVLDKEWPIYLELANP